MPMEETLFWGVCTSDQPEAVACVLIGTLKVQGIGRRLKAFAAQLKHNSATLKSIS